MSTIESTNLSLYSTNTMSEQWGPFLETQLPPLPIQAVFAIPLRLTPFRSTLNWWLFMTAVMASTYQITHHQGLTFSRRW